MMGNTILEALRSSKHKDGSIHCGEDYVEIEHDKFFISLQRPNQLALNECERSHTFKFFI
jgi:hypothetical protein